MLRVADPVGGASLPRVSPKIRNLQDRLMDSLPTDGAWECLSPAQREAILSLHHNRLLGNINNISGNNNNNNPNNNNINNIHHNYQYHHQDDPIISTTMGGRGRKVVHGVGRYSHARSRSYEDKLESETDDSGARGLGGTSSGSHSHNSHEDDSSDPGVNRPKPLNGVVVSSNGAVSGRFTKANVKSSSVDRANLRKPVRGGDGGRGLNYDTSGQQKVNGRPRGGGVTNGFGNVNKMISKQINKSGGIANSNITLDCRNVQGEKRRRSCIFADDEDPFRSGNFEYEPEITPVRSSKGHNNNNNNNNNHLNNNNNNNNNIIINGRHDDPVPADRAGLSRRKILNKYETENSAERNFNDVHSKEYRDYRTSSGTRATPTSEEYDSGVNFRLDNGHDLEGFMQEQPKSLSYLMTSGALGGGGGNANNFTSLHNGGFHSGSFMAESSFNTANCNTRFNKVSNNNVECDPGHRNGRDMSSVCPVMTGVDSSRSMDYLRGGGKEEMSVVATAAGRAGGTSAAASGAGLVGKRTNCEVVPPSRSATEAVTPSRYGLGQQLNTTNGAGTSNTSAMSESTTSSLEGGLKNVGCGKMGGNGESPLKSNLKSGCGAKMNSSLDYRSTMNQDAHNRYSSNWNEMILNNNTNQAPAKASVKYNACRDASLLKATPNPLAKSTGNLTNKSIADFSNLTSGNNNNNNFHSKNEVNFLHNDLENWDNVHDRLSPKKYIRSKSLDRKYLEDSSEDESDFEARRRFERERRYARNPEWDALRVRQTEHRLKKGGGANISSGNRDDFGGGRLNKVNWETSLATDIALQQQQQLQRSPLISQHKPKSRSVWDLSNGARDEFEEPDHMMSNRSRVEMRSRWQNIDKKLNGDISDLFDQDVADVRREDPIRPVVPSRGKRKEMRDNNDMISGKLEETRTPVGRRREEKFRKARLFEEEAIASAAATKSPTMGRLTEALNASLLNDVPHKPQWRRTEFQESRDFAKKQWRRRSCDFELDGPTIDEPMSLDPVSLDRKRWYRRSCDLDLDFDQHYQQEMLNELEQERNFLSKSTVEQFQSLPPYHEGLQLPEEIIVDKKRCAGRREGGGGGIRSSLLPSSLSNHQSLDDLDAGGVPLTPEEMLMLDSGHEMYLMDKSRLQLRDAPSRVDGRCKSRMDENIRLANTNNIIDSNGLSRKGRIDDRPKTSIGHYGKEKRDRSRTPHGLKGKLRLFKSILSF